MCCLQTSGIVTEQGLREEVPHVLQYHVLKVALELPANKFAWFRVQVRNLKAVLGTFSPLSSILSLLASKLVPVQFLDDDAFIKQIGIIIGALVKIFF